MKDVLKKERFFVLIIILTFILYAYTIFLYSQTEIGPSPFEQQNEEIIPLTEETFQAKLKEDPLKYRTLLFFDTFFILAALILIFRGFVSDVKIIVNRFKKRKRIFFLRADDVWALEFYPFLRAVVMIFFFWSVLQYFQVSFYPIFYQNSIVLALSLSIFFQVCGILAILYYTYKNKPIFKSKRRFLRNLKVSGKMYIRILPIYILATYLTSYIAEKFNAEPYPQDIISILMKEQNITVIVLLILSAVVFAPLFEELFFRGLIFRFIRKKFTFFSSALITSLFFSLAHDHYFSFLPILVLGFSFAYIYERTKNIAMPILVHSIHNIVVTIMVFLSKAHM